MYSRARNGYACQYQHPDIAGREIWGKLDLIYDDWRGATRDPELDMSRTWEWKLMEQIRVSFFLVQDSCGGAVLRIGVLSSRSRTCHVSGETDGFPLLWTRAASSFCGLNNFLKYLSRCACHSHMMNLQCRPNSWQEQIFLFNPGVL